MTHSGTMTAMVLDTPRAPLQPRQLPVPSPGPGEVLLRVRACGVCRTDLHLVDGELPQPPLPVIPGHEIVGEVVTCGESSRRFAPGQRVGVPWLGWTCGTCASCRQGQENLCPKAQFHGYTRSGGYAQYVCADERYCFPIPPEFDDAHAAPLLCAGLIGYRSYRLCGEPVTTLGIYGFGAAAHIIAQIAVHQGKQVFAFTRPGDQAAQTFARCHGAAWAGDAGTPPPAPLDAAIIFAPAGELVPAALAALRPGGAVVCGGIHMSDIPSFPYRLLWEERTVRSVANLTRRDGEEFFPLAARAGVRTAVEVLPLADANLALSRLRAGELSGAAVLTPY